MSVLGQAQLYMQHRDKTTITFVTVAAGVSHSALISWHDLKYLGVIFSSFPHAQCSAVTASQLQESTFQAFPTVYKDSITDKPMAGNPVHVHLKDNAVPYRVSGARKIPLRF